MPKLVHVYDWAILEMEDSLAFGELRFRSKTKAGPLEVGPLTDFQYFVAVDGR